MQHFFIQPHEGMNKTTAPQGRLLGHRVLLYRMENEMARSPGGIILRDTYQHGSIVFRCLAAGPGGWAWRTVKNRRIRVWIQPEVKVYDYCLSCHWTEASEHPDWLQPQWLDAVDGTGRVVLDSRFIIAAWSNERNV